MGGSSALRYWRSFQNNHLAAILPPLLVAPPVMGKQLHNFATTTHRVHGAFYLPTFG